MSDMSSTFSTNNFVDMSSLNTDTITEKSVGGFAKVLELMFGNFVNGGNDLSLFSKTSIIFSEVAMIIFAIIASYSIIFGVVRIAKNGAFDKASAFQILKIVSMLCLILPTPATHGISPVQNMVIWFAHIGSNLADKAGYQISSDLTKVSFDSMSNIGAFENAKKLMDIAHCDAGLDKNNKNDKHMHYYYNGKDYLDSSALLSVYDGKGNINFGLSNGICGTFSANSFEKDKTEDIDNLNKDLASLNIKYLNIIYNNIILKNYDYSSSDFEVAINEKEKDLGSKIILNNSINNFIKIVDNYKIDFNKTVVNSLNKKVNENQDTPMHFSIENGQIVGKMKQEFYKKTGWIYMAVQYKQMSSNFVKTEKISKNFMNSINFLNPNGCLDKEGFFGYYFTSGSDKCDYKYEFGKSEIITNETNKFILQNNSSSDLKLATSCATKDCDKNIFNNSTEDYIRTSFLNASSSNANSATGKSALKLLSWGKGDVFNMSDDALDANDLRFTDAIGTMTNVAYSLKISSYATDIALQIAYGSSALVGGIPYIGHAGEVAINYTLDHVKYLNSFLSGTVNVAYISIPLMPIISFVFAVISYILIVMEAFICAPLACAMNCTNEGESLVGQNFQRFLNLVLAIILRPILIVFSLLMSIMLSNFAFTYFNQLYWYFIGDSIGSFDLGGIVFSIVMWFLLSYSILNSCFKIMITTPDSVMEWIAGGLSKKFGNDVDNDMMSSVQQSVSGSVLEKKMISGIERGREEKRKLKSESTSGKIRKN